MRLIQRNGEWVRVPIPIDEQDLVEESTWLHNHPMRIEVPLAMYFEPQYSIFLGYLVNIQKLPIERVSGDVHIYCNEIEEQFQGLIESDKRIKVTYRDD